MSVKPVITLLFLTFLGILSCTPLNYHHSIQSFNHHQPHSVLYPPSNQVVKTIFIDKNFTLDERSDIMAAANDWQAYSDGIVRYNLIFDYTVDLDQEQLNKIIMVRLDPDIAYTQELDQQVNGLFTIGFVKQHQTEYLFICPDRIIVDSLIKLSAEKLLGYELGLKQIAQNRPAIMNPVQYESIDCPTIYDMEEFCDKMMCNLDQVSYCEPK